MAALVTWTLTDYPIAVLRAGSKRAGQVSIVGLLWAQLGVLAVFWVWLAWVALARRLRPGHQAGGPGGSGGQTVAAPGLHVM